MSTYAACLPIFTKDHAEKIGAWRAAYDPLAALVPPHVTLLFPQEALSDKSLEDHIKEMLISENALKMSFDYVEKQVDKNGIFLFLKTYNQEATQTIEAWFTRLYSHPALKPTYDTDIPYKVHITVGRFKPDQLHTAEEAFQAIRADMTVMPCEITTIYTLRRDRADQPRGISPVLTLKPSP